MANNPGNTNTNGGAGPVSAAEPKSAPSPSTITAAAPSLIQNQLMQNNPQLINLLQQQQALAQQQQPATVTTQQYIPTAGPFYTLQQQQAFAQARLAALAAQSQAALQQKITTSTTATQQQGASSSNQVAAAGQQVVGGQQQQYIYSQPAVYANIMSQQQIQPQIQLQQNPNISVIGGGVSNVIAQQPQMNPVSSTATTATETTTSMPKGNSKTIVPPPSNKSTSPSEKQSSSIPTTTTSPTQQTLGTSGMSSTAAKLIQNALEESNKCELPPNPTPPASSSTSPYNNPVNQTVEEKKQSARDRNREHAKCTRLRKKAYVNKLKELVDGLHAERNEDERKRRVEVQKLAEMHETRRQVVHTFLGYHASYESDPSKWSRILETGESKDGGEVFKLKQPVTPYRSFSRCEIQKGSRILKGVDSMIRDSASMAVMIETIGSRNARWLQRKRDEFLSRDSSIGDARRRQASNVDNSSGTSSASGNMPSMVGNTRMQHAVSSLSNSSSGSGSSSNGSGSEEERKRKKSGEKSIKYPDVKKKEVSSSTKKAKKVSSSSSSDTLQRDLPAGGGSNDLFHDYNAPSLLDPLPEPGSQDSHSPDGMESDNCVIGGGKQNMCVDSSSGEDEKANPPEKKSKTSSTTSSPSSAPPQVNDISKQTSLPANIAKSGISHNVKVSSGRGYAKQALSRAPVTTLPPFAGLGKRKYTPKAVATMKSNTSSSSDDSMVIAHNKNSTTSNTSQQNGTSSDPNIITVDNQSTSSKASSQNPRGIQAHYFVNPDDMIITDDILMCPFIFRSQDAVWNGALAECVQPGMLRAAFSKTNKLRNVEMIFDAMGYCQQLERASGNEGSAQIIPNSLEMALAPNSEEARVITLAKAPFKIVSVNEIWTNLFGYTQLDVEGKDLSILNGERTNQETGTMSFENVGKGICAANTIIHYDSKGREFLDFMCSYPLSNLNNEVTHILHVCRELPAR